MVDKTINGNGHGEPEELAETEEQLSTVSKRLTDLIKNDGSLVSLSKQELGLLQTILRSTAEEYREIQFFRMLRFLSDDDAFNHFSAYQEAKELGMDTSYNVAYMFAQCSIDDRNNHSLISILTDTMQYGKWTGGSNKGKSSGSDNPRSPISG